MSRFDWKKGSKDLFWNVVSSTDFESVAREALFKALSDNSTGNVNSQETIAR